MDYAALLIECKKGLNIPADQTAFDSVLTQKIMAIGSYMTGAGVSDAMLTDDLATAAIVLGVTDLWDIQSGEVQFSSVFNIIVTQLAMRTPPVEVI